MWQALGDADRRAVRRRRAALRRSCAARARRRFRPATTSANSRPSARTRRRRSTTARIMHATAQALATCRHPLVAQIHGICVGGGLEIAALCDLRICGESSRFGAPIKNLGLVMAYAGDGAARAPRRRPRRARDPARGPRSSTPRRRRRRASSRASLPDAEVAAEARATAQRIAEGAPLVARWHKKFARRLADPRPLTAAGARRMLRLLRHRGFPHRLRGVPGQAEARVRRTVTMSDRAAGPGATGTQRPARRHARARARADHGRARRAA